MYIPVLELYVYLLLASVLDPIAGLVFGFLVCSFSVFWGFSLFGRWGLVLFLNSDMPDMFLHSLMEKILSFFNA